MLKLQAKQIVFRHFLENLDKKSRFFGAHFHPQNYYFQHHRRPGNILGSVIQKRISRNSTNGEYLLRQGIECLRGVSALPAP